MPRYQLLPPEAEWDVFWANAVRVRQALVPNGPPPISADMLKSQKQVDGPPLALAPLRVSGLSIPLEDPKVYNLQPSYVFGSNIPSYDLCCAPIVSALVLRQFPKIVPKTVEASIAEATTVPYVMVLANGAHSGSDSPQTQEGALCQKTTMRYGMPNNYPNKRIVMPGQEIDFGLSQMGYIYEVKGAQLRSSKGEKPFNPLFVAAPALSESLTFIEDEQYRQEYISYMSLMIRLTCEHALASGEMQPKLILGALGSGEYRNDAYLVATLYRLILNEPKYQEINVEFAISDAHLCDIYNEVFSSDKKKLQEFLNNRSCFNGVINQASRIVSSASSPLKDSKFLADLGQKVDHRSKPASEYGSSPTLMRRQAALASSTRRSADLATDSVEAPHYDKVLPILHQQSGREPQEGERVVFLGYSMTLNRVQPEPNTGIMVTSTELEEWKGKADTPDDNTIERIKEVLINAAIEYLTALKTAQPGFDVETVCVNRQPDETERYFGFKEEALAAAKQAVRKTGRLSY